MLAPSFQSALWSRVAFSAQPGIYLGAVASLRVPCPPLDRQRSLIDRLDAQSISFDFFIRFQHANCAASRTTGSSDNRCRYGPRRHSRGPLMAVIHLRNRSRPDSCGVRQRGWIKGNPTDWNRDFRWTLTSFSLSSRRASPSNGPSIEGVHGNKLGTLLARLIKELDTRECSTSFPRRQRLWRDDQLAISRPAHGWHPKRSIVPEEPSRRYAAGALRPQERPIRGSRARSQRFFRATR